MNSFNIEFQSIVLLAATLLTGLSAGLCFNWSNAITPGIGKLNDISYLKSFQQMNRSVLNPLFFIVFLGPVLLSFAASYVYRENHTDVFWMFIIAAVIYLLGVFIVTVVGNIPLNNLLEKANLADISLEDAKSLRDKFESKWNNFHLIRTLSSSTSFLLMLLTFLVKNNTINI